MASFTDTFGDISSGIGQLVAEYPPLGGLLDYSCELRRTATGKWVVLTFAGKRDRIPPWRSFESELDAIRYACACQNATRPELHSINETGKGE